MQQLDERLWGFFIGRHAGRVWSGRAGPWASRSGGGRRSCRTLPGPGPRAHVMRRLRPERPGLARAGRLQASGADRRRGERPACTNGRNDLRRLNVWADRRTSRRAWRSWPQPVSLPSDRRPCRPPEVTQPVGNGALPAPEAGCHETRFSRLVSPGGRPPGRPRQRVPPPGKDADALSRAAALPLRDRDREKRGEQSDRGGKKDVHHWRLFTS